MGCTRCYTLFLADLAEKAERVFQNSVVFQSSEEGLHPGRELCAAIRQVMLGQCDDLGGGVFKKRLGKNLYRSIGVARGGRYWVYAYLFAKQDRANIANDEWVRFRALAGLYGRKTDADIEKELRLNESMEICHDQESQVQE